MPAGRFSFLTFFLKNDKIGMELCDARTGIFLKNAPDRMNDMFNEAMDISELNEFQLDGGRLTGYPLRPEIGREYSGGSLGMAISVGVGQAQALRELA